MPCCDWERTFPRMVLLRKEALRFMCRTLCLFKRKNEPHKQRPSRNNQERPIFLHVYLLISECSQLPPWLRLLHPAWGCPPCQAAPPGSSLHLLRWGPASEHRGLRWKHYVITRAFCARSSLIYFITTLFHCGKRNPRYKTPVGNWHWGSWRTSDTILNFKMKGECWWQNSLDSAFEGQRVTSQKVEWSFQGSVNTSCA